MLRYLSTLDGFDEHAVQLIVSSRKNVSEQSLLKCMLKSFHLPSQLDRVDAYESLAMKIASNDQSGIRTIWVLDRPLATAARNATVLSSRFDSLRLVPVNATSGTLNHQVDQNGSASELSLGCLDPSETAQYVRTCLRDVGGPDDLFSPSAIVALHKYSGGKLGKVSQLACASMQRAFDLKCRQVTLGVVQFVTHRLDQNAA